MKVFLLSLLLLGIITLVSGNSGYCKLSGRKGTIDLTKQAFSSDVTVFGRGFWDLMVNICKPVATRCKDITGVPALWLFYNDPSNCNRISSPNTTDTVIQWQDCKLSYIDISIYSREGGYPQIQ